MSFNKAVDPKTDTNPNEVQIVIHCLEYESKPIIFLISHNISTDLKGPKVKYKLHYGQCHYENMSVQYAAIYKSGKKG